MKRWLIALTVLPAALLIVLLFIIGTESGLRLALWPVKTFAPDTLQVESVEGKLIGPLDITGLSLSTQAVSVEIDSLALRWNPSALFKRNLNIERLSVDGVIVTPTGDSAPVAESDDAPFTVLERLELPISAELKNISISNISLNNASAADPLLIDVIALQLQYDRDADTLKSSVEFESSLFTAESSLDIDTRDSYPISGQIDWSANLPDLARVNGATTISGTINALTIEQQIASPYSLAATVILRDALESLVIDASGRVDISSTATIRSDLPAIGVAGDFSFNGEPQDGALHSSLTFTGELPGTINSALSANIQQQFITLDALQLSVDGQPLELLASGTADFSAKKPLIDLLVRWDALRWPWTDEPSLIRATGNAKLQGSPDNATLAFETSFNDVGMIAGAAKLMDSDIDADIQWTTLQWPGDGNVADNITGRLKIDGKIDGYTLMFNSTLDTPQLNGIKLKANGAGTQQSLYLPSLEAHAADGTLDGSVQVDWAPVLSFAAVLKGDSLNPGVFAPDFPGNLAVSIKAQGETIDNTLKASLKQLNLAGELRGQELTANAQASINGKEIALETLKLTTGDTSLDASGTVSNQVNLAFSLDSPDLSALLPDAAGSIKAQGQVGGSSTEPSIQLNLAVRSLVFKELALQSLDLAANVDTSDTGPVDVNLAMGQSTAAGVFLESLNLKVDGGMDAHKISLTGKSDQGDIDLSLSGAYAEQNWRYTIEKATLAYPNIAPWRLNKPAGGEVSAQTVSLRNACLSSAEAQLCITAEQSAAALDALYELSRFNLDTLQAFLPTGTALAGTLESNGAVSLPANKSLAAEFSVSLNSATLDVDNSDGDSVRVLALQPSEVIGSLNEKGAILNARLNLGEQGKLQAAIAITGTVAALMEGSLSGQVKGALNNVDVVEQMLPVLENVEGTVAIDFELAGTPRTPLLNGELLIANGNVALTEPGIVISDATARISANGNSELGVLVTARSNEGSMRVDGTVDLAANPSPEVKLTLTGEQFQVINTLEAEAALSPDLNIGFNSKGLMVSGVLNIPVLAITPKKVPAGVVAVSADQKVIGQESTKDIAAPVDVRADVKILLGDDVFIDAFGLNAALSGSLTVKEVPGKETTATGQLEIQDGSFRAYGQNLVIQKGRIIYAGGPISKPGFDIEAVRKVTSELQVGIRARGAMANPQFSLFSDPPMSESEQMSYLVLGRPLQDNSPSENSAMRQAAMALGVAGGKLLTEKFGDKLGLDQVAIDSELRETGEQAVLVVGKYLSPRLFVSYGIGLFEPVSTLKLDYTINRNIKLISETTESKSGGDIVFTFEGGK